MTESVESTEEVRFIRLRDGTDIVALTIELPTSLIIKHPVGLKTESSIDSNRNIVTIYEWMNPTIVKFETLTIDIRDVLFCLPVQSDFESYYFEVTSILFDPEMFSERKTRTAKKSKKALADTTRNLTPEESNNVISMVEAIANLIDKKDKPIH